MCLHVCVFACVYVLVSVCVCVHLRVSSHCVLVVSVRAFLFLRFKVGACVCARAQNMRANLKAAKAALVLVMLSAAACGGGSAGRDVPCAQDMPARELIEHARLPNDRQPAGADWARVIACLSLAVAKDRPGDGLPATLLGSAYSNLALAYFNTHRLVEAEASLTARQVAGIALDTDGNMMLVTHDAAYTFEDVDAHPRCAV